MQSRRRSASRHGYLVSLSVFVTLLLVDTHETRERRAFRDLSSSGWIVEILRVHRARPRLNRKRDFRHYPLVLLVHEAPEALTPPHPACGEGARRHRDDYKLLVS